MRLLALCCVLTGALALAACGGSSSSSSQASPSPEASTAEGAALGSPGPAASGSAAEAAPSTAPTRAGPFFSDLTGIYGADKIEQLAQLQVYGPINSYSFDPTKPIMRREFVVWIFNANNAIQDDETKKIHNAAPGGAGYFSDVPPTDRDFSVIQGMQDAGIAVGFPDRSFKPDEPITREQAVAIADGVSCAYNGNWSNRPDEAYGYLPDWKDKNAVSKSYAPILASCLMQTEQVTGRAFGKIQTFNPTSPVARSEAALMVWQIGNRTAQDALQTAATATATP